MTPPRAVTLVLAVAALIPAAGAAEGGSAPRPEVLLMGPAAEEGDLRELVLALEAQFSDLEVTVAMRLVDRVPAETTAQLEMVRAAGRSEGLLSVVWVERTAGELIVFAADRRSERLTVMALPRPGGSWRTDCDAVATGLRSLLLPWLAPDPGETPWAEVPGTPPAPPPSAPAPQPGRAPGPDSRKRVALASTLGWVAVGVDPGECWMHGAAVSLGLVFGHFLEVGAGSAILPALAIDVPGQDVHLERWPVDLEVTGLFPLAGERLEIGIRAGMTIDLTTVVGLEPGTAPDDTDAVRFAFVPAALLRWRLVSGLWVFAAGGAQIFSREREYLWDDEPRLRYRQVQPRFGAGLGFRLPVGR